MKEVFALVIISNYLFCQMEMLLFVKNYNGILNLLWVDVYKRQVFDESLMPHIISLITAVGFYEHTGDWIYTSGIPAKTGVGGGVMGCLPGVFGIAAFAPPLDDAGNSVKAQAAIKYIAREPVSYTHLTGPCRPFKAVFKASLTRRLAYQCSSAWNSSAGN